MVSPQAASEAVLTLPYATPERLVSGLTSAITGIDDTEVIAAGAAGIRNYITACSILNSHATVDTLVILKDGSTNLWEVYMPAIDIAQAGTVHLVFPTPLRLTAATAFNAAAVTTGSNIIVSATGFRAA